jgi:hypothetical protein
MIFQNLFDAVSLLISQFRQDIAILDRQRTIRHTRALISKVIEDHFSKGSVNLIALRESVETGLARVKKTVTPQSPEHSDYISYCLREVTLAFELADQIYTEYHKQPELALTLIQDLPILRPFDYGTTTQVDEDFLPVEEDDVVGQ